MSQNVILDNHFHLNYSNDFLLAAKIFEKAGGTAINLTNLPQFVDLNEDYYDNVYQRTMRMAGKIKEMCSVDVLLTIGPYPLDILNVKSEKVDRKEFIKNGIDLAIKYIENGRANALGEIGRIHFPGHENLNAELNEILQYAMDSCRDVKCPIILHTEDLDEGSIKQLDAMARGANLEKNKVIKHHGLPQNLSVNSDLIFSIPATRGNIKEVMKQEKPFFLETDYIDDPMDKNRYLPADSVPRRYKTIIQEYGKTRDALIRKVFNELPRKVYGDHAFRSD